MRFALLFFVILLCIAVSASAHAGSKDCRGALCRDYHHPAHGPGKAVSPLLCIAISQEKADVVVVRFYDRKGRELDKGDRLHSQRKPAGHSMFCAGRHWFVAARAGHVEVCNSILGRPLLPQHIDILLKDGMPQGKYVHLYR